MNIYNDYIKQDGQQPDRQENSAITVPNIDSSVFTKHI